MLWPGGGTFIRQRRALGALTSRYAWRKALRSPPYPTPALGFPSLSPLLRLWYSLALVSCSPSSRFLFLVPSFSYPVFRFLPGAHSSLSALFLFLSSGISLACWLKRGLGDRAGDPPPHRSLVSHHRRQGPIPPQLLVPVHVHPAWCPPGAALRETFISTPRRPVGYTHARVGGW